VSDPIWQEALELVAATPDDTDKGELWTNNNNATVGARGRLDSCNNFIHWLTSVDCFTSPHFGNEAQIICDAWLAILNDVPVGESPHATENGIVIRDGKRLSTQLLLHTYYAERIDTIKPMRILEIGAGFGGLARILNTKTPRQYTILDIPGSLFCSYVYLKTHFPGRIFTWCHTADDLAAPADFRFVPARLWKDLMCYRFDMAVNTCSLGEMLPETVADYMRLIGETCQYFYSHNRAGLERMPPLPMDTALPAVPLDSKWEILFDETGGKAQTDPAAPPSRELLVRRLPEYPINEAIFGKSFRDLPDGVDEMRAKYAKEDPQ
jgi:hypothetical protein